jgi:hypothetical protein
MPSVAFIQHRGGFKRGIRGALTLGASTAFIAWLLLGFDGAAVCWGVMNPL